jgi:hypothetical protein
MPPLKKITEGFELQDRDLALLCALFESRAMTISHISALCFSGHAEATKKRLQKLKKAGLIRERERFPTEPAVLFLASKGLKLLKEYGVLDEYPPFSLQALLKRTRVSELTILHELEVMDVKASFHSAISSRKEFSIERFTTWPALIEFKAAPRHSSRNILVRPDGYICIHETVGGVTVEDNFFLEVDRSSEVQDILVDRANCYLDYYISGGFAVKKGGRSSDIKDYPFRVLMVFRSAERRNNIAERLLQNDPPILTQVCLSTIAEVKANPLGAIWITPLSYRDATKGTPFQVSNQHKQWGYQRQSSRDTHVERTIRKQKILNDVPR